MYKTSTKTPTALKNYAFHEKLKSLTFSSKRFVARYSSYITARRKEKTPEKWRNSPSNHRGVLKFNSAERSRPSWKQDVVCQFEDESDSPSLPSWRRLRIPLTARFLFQSLAFLQRHRGKDWLTVLRVCSYLRGKATIICHERRHRRREMQRTCRRCRRKRRPRWSRKSVERKAIAPDRTSGTGFRSTSRPPLIHQCPHSTERRIFL